MDRGDAYQRRAWRLAYLLNGGDPDGAAAVMARVITAQPRLETLDPAHLDRLVVLSARHAEGWHGTRKAKPERRGRTGAGPTHPSAARPEALAILDVARTMPRQCLEAWILGRVDQLDLTAVSRAMDCSRTAATRHVERAEELMTQAVGPEQADRLASLRACVDALDPGPAVAAFRQEQRRRRRLRSAIAALAVAGIALVALVVLASLWVLGR